MMTNNSTPAPMVFFSTQFDGTNNPNDTEHSHEIALLISALAGCCSLVTVVGNIMVILSYMINQSLRNFSNYMILSLALSDLTIGAFSMNVFTTYNVHQSWTLGQDMCKAWLSVDYTASNASVMNLLVICVDRYIAITKPVKYRRWCTPRKAALAITGVWLISFLMWVPAITLWDVISENATLPEGQCYIPFINHNPYLSVATIVVAFYFPAFLMCALYRRVIHKLKRRRRGIRSIIQDASVTIASRGFGKNERRFSCNNDVLLTKTSTNSNAITTKVSENVTVKEKVQIVVKKETLLSFGESSKKLDTLAELSTMSHGNVDTVTSSVLSQNSSRQENDAVGLDRIMNADRRSAYRPKLRRLHGTVSLRGSANKAPLHDRFMMKSKSISYSTDSENEKETLTRQITRARESQRSIRERKITVLLKFILLCFILLWLPYSLIVVIAALCPTCIISSALWNLSYWLCYLNSTVNPLCYGFCNENFRRTFKAIVTTPWWTKESRKNLRLGRKASISKSRSNMANFTFLQPHSVAQNRKQMIFDKIEDLGCLQYSLDII